MAILECKYCSKEKEMPNYRLKRAKYCSHKCSSLDRRDRELNWITLFCQQCKKEFAIPNAWVKAGRRKFCSRECKTQSQIGIVGKAHARFGKKHSEESKQKMSANRKGLAAKEKSPRWKGGVYYDSRNYRYLMLETLSREDQDLVRSMATKSNYVAEHRLVMARVLNRPLTKREVVHHLNGDKIDNRIENLQLFPKGEHSRRHREIDKELSRAKKLNEELQERIEILEEEVKYLKLSLRISHPDG